MLRTLRSLTLLALLWSAATDAATDARIELVAAGGEGPFGGPAAGAKLIRPFGVAFDKQGAWYIVEWKGHRVTKVDRTGMITIFAGTGEQSYGADGGPAGQAQLNDPHRIVISPRDQMYIADTGNNRVRRVDLATGKITTIAGLAEAGYSGDGGLAAKAAFNGPFTVELRDGQLYIADLRNRRVRKVNLKTNIVDLVAGNGQQGVPHDGALATQSPLVDPRAATVDSQGNVYILERAGNALRVVDRSGRIRTLIRPGDIQPDFNGPKDLCIDLGDNVIIADSENHLIRKYDPETGKVTTVAGTGEEGHELVSGDPLKTELYSPHGVYVHASGALYISDSNNHRVLKLTQP